MAGKSSDLSNQVELELNVPIQIKLRIKKAQTINVTIKPKRKIRNDIEFFQIETLTNDSIDKDIKVH